MTDAAQVEVRFAVAIALLLAALAPRHAGAAEGSASDPGGQVQPPPAADLVPEPTLEPGAPSAPEPAASDVADLDLEELVRVRVSPFEVSVGLDQGYRAANSVTGSRFDAPIGELPFAIQAFTGSFIADQKPVNVFDVARYSPGVTYRSNDFNEGNANLAIRGFAVSSTIGNVQMLRDGFHGPSIFDFTNIDRLEVVKGPASFLYGQVAPGGIVNVITKSPQPQPEGSVSLRAGSYGQYRFEGDVTGPLSRSLSYRFAASYDQDIHYWDPYDAHAWDIAPSVRWQPHERLSVTVKYEYFHKRETPQLMQKPGYNTQAGVVPTEQDPNLSGVDVPGLPDTWNSMAFSDYRQSDARQLSTWVDVEADAHWSLRAGYSHLEYKIDAVASGNLGMANNTTRLQGRRVRGQTYANLDDTFELQALGRYRWGPTSLRLLLGAQHVLRRFDSWAGQAPNDPTLGDTPTASPFPLWDLTQPATWDRSVSVARHELTANRWEEGIQSKDESLYAGATIGLFEERLLALVGWRVTSTDSQSVNLLTGQAAAHITATRLTPQVGLLFKLFPRVALFASYAESFVPATRPLFNPDGSTSVARPTEGLGVDVGVKASLLDGRVQGTVTLFEVHNRFIVNDLSVLNPVTGAQGIYNVQSGQQRSRGLELDATLSPLQGWQLYLSYSVMDARIVEFSGHDATILAQDPAALDDVAARANYKNVRRFHDAPLQMSAPHLANLWTRWELPRELVPGLSLAGGVNLVVDQALLPDGPASSHQTYVLVSAVAGYSWTWSGYRMSLELMGKNLADARYRPSQSTRARPREFLVTLTARR